MSVLKDIAQKYDGIYTCAPLIKIHTPQGLEKSQEEKVTFKIERYKFIIQINNTGGISSTEPYRINLILDKKTTKKLGIFPKKLGNIIWLALFGMFTINIPLYLQERYVFKGNRKWLREIFHSQKFRDEIEGKKLYIHIKNKKYLTLTPENGLKSVKEIESLATILIEIQKALTIITK